MDIELQKVGKRFSRNWIFKGITISIPHGQRLAIQGRNGSGKSTLLKVISHFLSPTQGAIHYRYPNSQDKVALDSIPYQISFAAPYIDLIEELTLQELFQFHSRFRTMNCSYTEWINRLELEKHEYKPMQYFSSGMKQRVRLGLALHTVAQVYLLDEPTTNLDENAKQWYLQQVELCVGDNTLLVASNESIDFEVCSDFFAMESVEIN